MKNFLKSLGLSIVHLILLILIPATCAFVLPHFNSTLGYNIFGIYFDLLFVPLLSLPLFYLTLEFAEDWTRRTIITIFVISVLAVIGWTVLVYYQHGGTSLY